VGVVQPLTAGIDDEIGDGSEPDAPLFSVGCLGILGEVGEDEEDEEPVGLVWGAVRFRVVEELPPILGYRRVRVDYSEFRDDLDRLRAGLEFPALKAIVRQRIEDREAELDKEITDRMMGTEIVTALAHAIAFSAAERQVLMETPSLHDLETVLLGLMEGPGGYLRFDQPPLIVN
jgi:Lon protease-like protein